MYRYLPGAGTDTGIYIGAFVRHLHLPADGSGDNVHRRRGTDGELLPQDDIAGLTRVLAASLVAATLVICARRLYVRKFVVKWFGLDDWMVVVAMTFVCLFGTLSVVITYYGMGKHFWNVSPRDLAVLFKIDYVAHCSYLYISLFIKISLLVFLKRYFPDEYIQRTSRGLIIFLTVFTVSSELAIAFQCTPGLTMFVTDVVIPVLPMQPLWRLRVPLRERLPLMGLFLLGAVACAASLIRFTTLVYTKDEVDGTYLMAKSAIWANVEFCFGLVAGSIPRKKKDGEPGVGLRVAAWMHRPPPLPPPPPAGVLDTHTKTYGRGLDADADADADAE
ncbi:hypothetical protein BZA05DRAFT_436556 [Tricharina praecox]|uniref:uncharacterized protein n=1 Tax=Tricharina praecox TaxID=43433 RepID=UPI00221F2E30|nr:uncharacterized protein BZA05DRAFT_436556 [Tricharina praecox]KAI5850998.1 hypothetical protein BZA05DRAFT_436556 [Tricharina praecox]